MQILENVFNPSTLNIMLAIKSTGTEPGCRVLSIGLVYFIESGIEGSAYILPSIEDQAGVDESRTLEWWKEQSADASCVFADNIIGGVSVKDAAEEMKAFIDECIDEHMSRFPSEGKPNLCIWGNSVTSNNVILAKMFRDNGIDDIPWAESGNRCYRTLTKTLDIVVPKSTPGIKHNAVDDAVYQANVLIETLKNVD